MKNFHRGSTILVVLIATLITGIAATSVMALIKTQRRLALRKELEMQAINAAEGALDYAYSILIVTAQVGEICFLFRAGAN